MAGHDADTAAKPRRNPFLALADPQGGDGSTRLPFLDPVWMSHAFTMAQTVVLPFAFYFKPVVVLVAVFWLFYRAYQVLNKPLEELAGLLGFDIPSAPIIDLASIKADGAIVHWSLPEKQRQKSTFKFEIHLNGTVIDTLSIQESAATITGLQPGCSYVVRVSLINNVDFSSSSDPIRFRTKPATSGDFFSVNSDAHDHDQDGLPESVPRIRPYKGLKDIAPATHETTPATRDGNSSLAPRRSIRRTSPAAIVVDKHDPPTEDSEAPEGAETMQQLTEKLDATRKEIVEAERASKEEDEEEAQQKDVLSSERDDLKKKTTEKEKASQNLKREVNSLGRQNTAAQNERNKQENLLKEKKAERKKLEDDMTLWEKQAVEMKADLGRIGKEKEQILEELEAERKELRDQQDEHAAAIKILDEEVKEKSIELKKIERALKNSSPSASEPEPNLVHQIQQENEEKRIWEAEYSQMQQHYAAAAQKLEQSKRFLHEQMAYLENVRRRRQEEAVSFASPPPTLERPIRRGDSQRSRRAQSGHSSSESPRMGGFPITSAPFVPSTTSTASMFQSAPFLNIHNGMTISGPTDEMTISDEDRDRLTGGAPMSPGAGAELLPANLFGDGEDKQSSDFIQPIPGLGSLPGLPGIPGPSNQPIQEHPGPGPASPASGSSRSPSVFASPLASQQNLYIGSPEIALDADRRSTRSTRSNRATSGGGSGSRFSGMFGIKQRAKTTSADEGPALGKAQSHSMPRQDQGIPGIDSNSRKRNSSVSGSVFSNPSLVGDGPFEGPQPPPQSRSRRAFNFFSRDKANDGWPSAFRRPASPRPDSTHSTELPRPSMDSSRWGIDTWPSSDAAGGARSSPLAFGGPGWNTPQQSRLFGPSRHPSRRPSIQQGNSSGPPEDILEDDDSDYNDSYRAARLGAIGTKPPVGSKKAEKAAAVSPEPAKLNPNAKDFKSFFSSMKLTKDRSKDGTACNSGTPNPDKGEFEESPPNSRKSKDTRDTYSMTTTESSLAESSRNSVDLARTPSYSTSDAPAPSPMLGGSVGKESFMQKLSRKSSSSKFTLPTFKREKTARQSEPPTSAPLPPEAEEDGEDMSASIGSMPAKEKEGSNRGSVRNWSSVLKLGKSSGGSLKKGNETPSVSGMSLTSAEGEDDGEDQ